MRRGDSPPLFIVALGFIMVAAACGGSSSSKATSPALSTPTVVPPMASPPATPLPATGPTPTAPADTDGAALARERFRSFFGAPEWRTDFSLHSVPYDEIISGGPPRDGIPPIDTPTFISVAQAAESVKPQEPVAAFVWNGDARAYPLSILIWHEIVNDVVGGKPVAVTFCPLCNTSITLDRTVEGRALRFGTTGLLRRSDLVMWDDATESWWQQGTGEAIVGSSTGAKLAFLPTDVVSLQDFQERYPDGKVLSSDTGFRRNYGANPYEDYDSSQPFLFFDDIDSRLPAMERVVGVRIGEAVKAYPFTTLEAERVVNDQIDGRNLAVLWKPGVLSALDDAVINKSRDTGAAAVYDRVVDGHVLTFVFQDGVVRDRETGTEWNFWGQGVQGPLAGRQLTKIINVVHFWFSWASFFPSTAIYGR
ncbi:MAG: DUF3179 domain-containing protein [Chloroflexi bacterium]|nr:DUF3179 domain-containing protein [Chloroflexota bacterium]